MISIERFSKGCSDYSRRRTRLMQDPVRVTCERWALSIEKFARKFSRWSEGEPVDEFKPFKLFSEFQKAANHRQSLL